MGGRDAEVDEFPWQAHLVIHNPDLKDDILRCGGVLVHDRVVLTAAHCVTGVGVCVSIEEEEEKREGKGSSLLFGGRS